MITNIRNIQVHPNGELSNDDYHGPDYEDHASGSALYQLYSECPADFKFSEKEPTAALHFGTASHAAMLEPELFDKQFVRAISKEDDVNYLTSDAGIKKVIKDAGIPGYSNKQYSDLVIRALDIDPDVKIFNLECEIQFFECADKTLVKGEDFDNIMQMRKVLFADDDNVELFAGAAFEVSIICEIEINDTWHKVKIRPDIITKSGMVPDYKTTASMKPEDFARQAYYAGYWFKQAFVHDILCVAYDASFGMALLAQGKKSPFIPQLYMLSKEQLQVGREQYMSALSRFEHCKKTDVWPAYFDGAVELQTPDYIAKKYGFN